MPKLNFDRIACVSRQPRPEFSESFRSSVPRNWSFRDVEKKTAADGERGQSSTYCSSGSLAWDRYDSHLKALEDCLNKNIESCLFLEDDAVCCKNFPAKLLQFSSDIPSDWEMIYLGGQHLDGERNPPIKINENVFIPYNVNGMFAFAIRGASMMNEVCRHLSAATRWSGGRFVDYNLDHLLQRRLRKIYCPSKWMFGRVEDQSGSSCSANGVRFFPAAEEYQPLENDFVIVLGLHRSGSSCLATMLHKLGIYMGDHLTGFESRHGGGGEAHDLAKICESSMPFPTKKLRLWKGELLDKLLRWMRDCSWQAHQRGTIAGGKYPHLCAWAGFIATMLGKRLKVIHIDRPLEESIESLGKRIPMLPTFITRSLQEFLWESKNDFLKQTKNEVLNLEFSKILEDPVLAVEQIIQFLGVSPTQEQIREAVAHPKRKFRSCNLSDLKKSLVSS